MKSTGLRNVYCEMLCWTFSAATTYTSSKLLVHGLIRHALTRGDWEELFGSSDAYALVTAGRSLTLGRFVVFAA